MSTHELWTSRDCFSNVPLWLLLSDNSSKLFDLQVNSVFLCVNRGLGFFNPSLRIFWGIHNETPFITFWLAFTTLKSCLRPGFEAWGQGLSP